jgi:SAM-dependent methyltransferase
LGDIVQALRARGPIAEAGLIGLGAGTAAAYGDAGERFTYFEIDPAVARIAQNPAFFTYLSDSRAAVSVVLGDGRRRIAESPDGRFDLIVLDAFSSDAIPVHLLTREAVALYLRKLKPNGCLALHLTNGYLALDPVVTAIAADLGVPAAIKRDAARTPEQAFEGKDYSKWAIMGRDQAVGLPVGEEDGWYRTPSDRGPGTDEFLWTDDRSNIVGLLLRR